MELIDLGKTPIPGPHPAGRPLEDLPALDALAAELARQTALSGPAVDWEKVIQLASGLLAEQGKDLKVACQLASALVQTRGQEGLALALRILRDLLETFWETMAPPRVRARRNALEALFDLAGQAVERRPPVQWPRERREALLEDFQAIDQILAERMEDSPNLLPLSARVAGWVEEVEEPRPEPQSAAPPPSQPSSPPPAPAPPSPAPAPAPPAPDPAPPPSLTDPEHLLDEVGAYLHRAGAILRAQKPSDPVPYRLHRLAAWLSWAELPPAQGNRTGIPRPRRQDTSGLDAARTAQNWEQVLSCAEDLIAPYPLWMDLNRMAAEALDALDRGAAARSVEQETRAFHRRLPGLAELCFADGTPFADEPTRQWLQEPGQEAGGPDRAAALDPVLAEAKALADGGEPLRAASLLALAARSAGSGRASFQLRTALCAGLARFRSAKVMAAMAEDLLSDLEAFQVHRWEPELALAALKAMLEGLRSNPSINDKIIEKILMRLVSLDPSLALKLEQP
ncbi:MAG: type VI secretion system protein TssA [Holophaga sp.]|nr:type VI secretion system protein TssA [Holophaga sp.]